MFRFLSHAGAAGSILLLMLCLWGCGASPKATEYSKEESLGYLFIGQPREDYVQHLDPELVGAARRMLMEERLAPYQANALSVLGAMGTVDDLQLIEQFTKDRLATKTGVSVDLLRAIPGAVSSMADRKITGAEQLIVQMCSPDWWLERGMVDGTYYLGLNSMFSADEGSWMMAYWSILVATATTVDIPETAIQDAIAKTADENSRAQVVEVFSQASINYRRSSRQTLLAREFQSGIRDEFQRAHDGHRAEIKTFLTLPAQPPTQ